MIKRTNHIFIIIVLFGLLFSCQENQHSSNNNFSTAYELYTNNQYMEAEKILIELGNNGNVLSQLFLADMYFDGQVTSKGYRDAINHLTKAASFETPLQVRIEANNLLADRYLTGNGVEKNIKKAMECYLIAVKFGSARAMYKLAELSSTEGSNYIDNSDPEYWYKKSVETLMMSSMSDSSRLAWENNLSLPIYEAYSDDYLLDKMQLELNTEIFFRLMQDDY